MSQVAVTPPSEFNLKTVRQTTTRKIIIFEVVVGELVAVETFTPHLQLQIITARGTRGELQDLKVPLDVQSLLWVSRKD